MVSWSSLPLEIQIAILTAEVALSDLLILRQVCTYFYHLLLENVEEITGDTNHEIQVAFILGFKKIRKVSPNLPFIITSWQTAEQIAKHKTLVEAKLNFISFWDYIQIPQFLNLSAKGNPCSFDFTHISSHDTFFRYSNRTLVLGNPIMLRETNVVPRYHQTRECTCSYNPMNFKIHLTLPELRRVNFYNVNSAPKRRPGLCRLFISMVMESHQIQEYTFAYPKCHRMLYVPDALYMLILLLNALTRQGKVYPEVKAFFPLPLDSITTYSEIQRILPSLKKIHLSFFLILNNLLDKAVLANLTYPQIVVVNDVIGIDNPELIKLYFPPTIHSRITIISSDELVGVPEEIFSPIL